MFGEFKLSYIHPRYDSVRMNAELASPSIVAWISVRNETRQYCQGLNGWTAYVKSMIYTGSIYFSPTATKKRMAE